MKRTVILLVLISANAHSTESCFSNNKAILELIRASEELDECFATDKDPCKLKKKSIDFQANVNSSRLIPLNRMAGDKFMNRTTGVISVKFGKYDGVNSEKQFAGSAQKISRCHIIAPAHLIYTDGDFPLESRNFSLTFKTGQTCDIKYPFENEVKASLFFKMTDKKRGDFGCKSETYNHACEKRLFRGSSDVVILKLDSFDKNDDSYFRLDTSTPIFKEGGQRINCWGYTSKIGLENVTSDESRMYLWTHKDARKYGDNLGKSFDGVLTNAVSRKGMSGGGCADSDNPRVLVGLYVNDNKSGGDAGIYINPNDVFYAHPNYLAAFHKLAERYAETNAGKRLSDLDLQCTQ